MNWTVNHTISWFDYTMTALAENRYRALKQQIDSLPARSVFDPDCTDADAEVLFEMSFLAREDAQAGPDTKAKLHTLDDLRTRVASGLTAEILLLSPMEHDLFVRTVLFGGKHILSNPALLHPALCLVRRLLCSIRKQDGELVLVMPDTIRATSMLILAADNHRQIREKIQDVHDRIDSTLYLIGFLLSAAPERNLAAILKDTPADQHPEYYSKSQSSYLRPKVHYSRYLPQVLHPYKEKAHRLG